MEPKRITVNLNFLCIHLTKSLQKFVISLDLFFNQLYILALDNTSLCIDYLVERCIIIVFLFGSIFPNLHFFINMLTALKNVQVGNDQEKAQSERNSHSKNRTGMN